MKKVTAFVGSTRKKNTYQVVLQFLHKLQSLGDIEYEIVTLSDYNLGACRGCQLCFEKGEEFCPLKDERDVLMDKMMASDGIVLASPNYCGHISGVMKTFVDRMGFVCHRPRYFGKVCTSIVTQAIAAGDKIVAYLDILAGALGFNVVKGTCVTPREPSSEKMRQKVDQILDRQARRYYAKLVKVTYPTPSFMRLMIFRISRGTIRQAFDDSHRDYRYYADKGWFDADYYYPTRLGLLKKAAGNIFDLMSARMARTS